MDILLLVQHPLIAPALSLPRCRVDVGHAVAGLPSQATLVQSAVKEKLSERLSVSDDVLPEYVMVMIHNQKPKAQVALDLEPVPRLLVEEAPAKARAAEGGDVGGGIGGAAPDKFAKF